MSAERMDIDVGYDDPLDRFDWELAARELLAEQREAAEYGVPPWQRKVR